MAGRKAGGGGPPPSEAEHSEQLGPDEGAIVAEGFSAIDFSKVSRRDLWLVFDGDLQVGQISRKDEESPWRVSIEQHLPIEIEFTSSVSARMFMLGYFMGRKDQAAVPALFPSPGAFDAFMDAVAALQADMTAGNLAAVDKTKQTFLESLANR